MFISKAKHEAALRRKDIDADGLLVRLESAQKTMERIFAANLRLATENDKLRKRLAPFERTRGKGGRFVKAASE